MYNGDLLENQELINALEAIPDILKGVMLTPDKQMEVYFRANPDAEDLDYYWCEDENKPKDIEDLGWDDVVTRGRSMQEFKQYLEARGATIVCALSIGRTYSDYYGEHREPHPWSGEY